MEGIVKRNIFQDVFMGQRRIRPITMRSGLAGKRLGFTGREATGATCI
jgi:CRISPR/Cas system endoribonuclease Cas6 (RAMP superfamily)